MKQPKSVLLSWIESIEKTGRNLSDWEQYFVESVKWQLTTHGKLSDRQEKIIENLYAEKTPNGGL